MGNAVFPTLLGQEWPIKKTPNFHTLSHKTAAGLTKRLSLQPYPIWTFELSYAYLSDLGLPTDDIQTLQGFFLNRYGSFDDFLFNDVTDNAVTNETFGIGDGLATQFQLVRAYGGFIEPILGPAAPPVLYDNGAVIPSANYTINTVGNIFFATPPAPTDVLSWTGAFYYRVHFLNDANDCSLVVAKWWESKKVVFESVLNSAG